MKNGSAVTSADLPDVKFYFKCAVQNISTVNLLACLPVGQSIDSANKVPTRSLDTWSCV